MGGQAAEAPTAATKPSKEGRKRFILAIKPCAPPPGVSVCAPHRGSLRAAFSRVRTTQWVPAPRLPACPCARLTVGPCAPPPGVSLCAPHRGSLRAVSRHVRVAATLGPSLGAHWPLRAVLQMSIPGLSSLRGAPSLGAGLQSSLLQEGTTKPGLQNESGDHGNSNNNHGRRSCRVPVKPMCIRRAGFTCVRLPLHGCP